MIVPQGNTTAKWNNWHFPSANLGEFDSRILWIPWEEVCDDVCVEVWSVDLPCHVVCVVSYLSSSVQFIKTSLPDAPTRPLEQIEKSSLIVFPVEKIFLDL